MLQGRREVFDVKTRRSVVASAEYCLFHVAVCTCGNRCPSETCSLQYDATNTAQPGRRSGHVYSVVVRLVGWLCVRSYVLGWLCVVRLLTLECGYARMQRNTGLPVGRCSSHEKVPCCRYSSLRVDDAGSSTSSAARPAGKTDLRLKKSWKPDGLISATLRRCCRTSRARGRRGKMIEKQ